MDFLGFGDALVTFEYKMVFDLMSAARIEGFLEREFERDRHYAVETVYFDTPDLSLFRQNVDSEVNRDKIRMRRYDPSDRELFIELKSRDGLLRRKRRQRVAASASEIDAFVDRMSASGMFPSLRTRYCRTRFKDPFGLAEITLDQELRFDRMNSLMPLFDGSEAGARLSDRVILEIKGGSSAECTKAMDRLRFGRVRSFSKYRMGISATH